MLSRREWLRLVGTSVTAGSLIACARGTIKPPDCAHFNGKPRFDVIDVHCHIFNATDLQVSAFLQTFADDGDGNSPLSVIAPAVQSIGWNFAPTAQDELKWLQSSRAHEIRFRALDTRPGAPAAAAVLSNTTTDSLARFHGFMMQFQKEQPDRYIEFTRRYAIRTAAFRLKRGKPRAILEQTFTGEFAAQPLLANPANLNTAMALESAGEIPPFLSFLQSFFRYRIENAWIALRMYGCDTTPGVDFITPALVDFDLWLGDIKEDDGRTKSHLSDQLLVAAEIARITQGRVHCFAPFNPLRAACDSDYVQLYREAIDKHGCVGFKLYPPNGFSPWNNAEYSLSPTLACTPKRNVSPAAIDTALANFYEFCGQRAVPIFAHVSPSNGARPGAQYLGCPRHWGEAITANSSTFSDDGKHIRLSFGHFGGDHDVTNQPGGQWTEECANLMRQHPFIYADMAYYARLLGPQNDEDAVAAVVSRLLRDPIISQRIMYGSDWIMLGIESGYQNYLGKFEDFLQNKLNLDDTVRAAILGRNAQRFLGIENANDPVRNRIEQFHRKAHQDWIFSSALTQRAH
jgi:predicted TIM-barrel fold metal-dependent hydrolase